MIITTYADNVYLSLPQAMFNMKATVANIANTMKTTLSTMSEDVTERAANSPIDAANAKQIKK